MLSVSQHTALSRRSSSSPGGSPSRASTPSQSSTSSEFLPIDGAAQPWTPLFSKALAANSFYDVEERKPFDTFVGLEVNTEPYRTSPQQGMMLEDLMNDDAYENGGMIPGVVQAPGPTALFTPFEPSLPSLPVYPSPPSSTSDESSPPSSFSPSYAPAENETRISVDERRAPESSTLQGLLATAPNATCPNTPVISPPQHTIQNLPILIHNVPSVGAKSRVETQIKMTLDLAMLRNTAVPYERVGSWKYLRLPKGTSTRRRARKEPKIDPNRDETLLLSVAVTCASDPSMPVSACTNCLAREAKRIERKKAARVRPQRHDSSDSEDFKPMKNGAGKLPKEGEGSGIVVFNCPEVNDFSTGRVVLPVRVTCYCRHHREKIGFRIAFTMSDANGRIVGRGSTPAIMITDDHKSVVKGAPHVPHSIEEAEEPVPKRNKRRLGKDADDADVEHDSRVKRRATKESSPSASVASTAAPSPSAPMSASASSAGTAFFPQNYYQRFEGSPGPSTYHPSTHASQSPSTFTTAPSSPLISAVQTPLPGTSSGGVFLHYPVTKDIIPPTTSSINRNVDPYMQVSEEMDLLSTSLAAAEAAATLPPTEMSAVQQQLQQSQHDPFYSALAYPIPHPGVNQAPLPPQIHRLIPASGPTHGGIEVTVLGANFLPSHRCVFGDTVAASTQMWSENTLVCLLPPSATPGPVVVSFEGLPLAVGGGNGTGPSGAAGNASVPGITDGRNNLQLFNYLDNSDRALMELALQVVGLKMTGRIEEAKDVAMRIVGTTSPQQGSEPTSMVNGTSSAQGLADDDGDDVVHVALHGRSSSSAGPSPSSSRDFQSVIIEFLRLLDVNVPVSSQTTTPSALSFANLSGQTLLHLSAILGFHRLLKDLVTRGIDVDVRDANGYTALHFAALGGRLACARILVEEGEADVEIVDAKGKSAREIAQWRDQVDVMELLERAEYGLFQSITEDEANADADESEVGWSSRAASVISEDDNGFEQQDEFTISSPTATVKQSVPEVDRFWDDESSRLGSNGHTVHSPVRPLSLLNALPTPSTSEKSQLDTAPATEKITNPQSLFHRTLSQIPTPALPTMPMLPPWAIPIANQLQFPALNLPDLQFQLPPLVFPAVPHMPTPSWPTGFPLWPGVAGGTDGGLNPVNGEKREYDMPSWFGQYAPGIGWWPMGADAEKDQSPPSYTLAASGSSSLTEPEKDASLALLEPSSSGTSTPKAVRFKLDPRGEEPSLVITERNVRYQTKKRQKLKQDRMLIFFWIPILLAVLLYGTYVGVPIVYMAIRDGVKQVAPMLLA